MKESTQVEETTGGSDPKGGRPVVPTRGERRPLGLAEVALSGGGFWAALQQTNAAATLAHCEQWMERLGWLGNFDRVADGTTGPDRPGWSFTDSEVYKLLEALAWEHGRTGDPRSEAALRRLTARIARAQDPDGYLNTCYGHPGRPPRYSDLEFGHELYCTGHLLQAAVARLRTAGPDELVAVARRAADHVCAAFGPGGLPAVCGHPGIEAGLAELGRALGEPAYVDQAQLFLDRRGHRTLKVPFGVGSAGYFQDDVPVRKADTWRGHAVRQLYLSAAAVDVAVERDDAELLGAVARQWAGAVARRTHLTGGMGSRHQDEGFGDDWELPPDRAYCETCAGVGSVMVSWRLHLATGEMRYADLMERTFYNVVAASPRADGRAFFYANPLQQRVAGEAPGPAADGEPSPRAEGGTRAAWFDVSCCPTNVARTLASWHTYLATAGRRDLTLLQYAGGRIDAELGDGRRVAVEVETAYPADGLVTVRVTQAPAGAVALRLRVPAWARGAVLEEGGRRRPAGGADVAVVDRALVPGEEIRLHLPVPPRYTWPDRRVDALRGCVAIERGPLVYCAESADLPDGPALEDVVVDTAVPPVERDGAVVVRALPAAGRPAAEQGWPYGPEPGRGAAATEPGAAAGELALVPYHRWAERGPSAMRVWLPAAQDRGA